MKDQKSQKGADDIIFKRKLYQQLLRMVSPIFRFT